MRIIIFLAAGLIFAATVQAQVGSSISADGTVPNDNAMLDVQSPATGAGKGMLIPRVTLAQRTTADAALAGGLLDNSGNLRGGVAQGLIVYQTDGSQGLYFNTSQTAAPAWVYLGNSTTNYLPLTGGTMSGALNMGAQIITNVSHIDFNGNNVSVGRSANGSVSGAALGWSANGCGYSAAVGYTAVATNYGVAMGNYANGAQTNVAIGVGAKTQGGTQRIAIGNNVTNNWNNTTVIRGTLYLDGGTGIVYRSSFGTGGWTAKAFTIDHPLDPENKVLRHFCLEGPQVWNVYAGNVQLVNGQAVVELPDYYSALNLVGSEIYSLTPIGEALIWVDREMTNNCFVIAGKRDIKVSWTIKVLRNDPGCREDLRRRPVEQFKSEIR